MSGPPNASDASTTALRHTVPPLKLTDLFFGFLTVGLRGFGGALPWARLMVVEERGWLDNAGFTALLGLCQILPGPNIVNLSVALGGRSRGAAGALAASSGLLACPLAIVLALGLLAERFGNLAGLALPIGNVGAAASGLIWAMALKMLAGTKRTGRGIAVSGAGFAAIAVLHWPLLPVVIVLVPLSLALEARASA